MKPSRREVASHVRMQADKRDIFEEEYRVVAVESHTLTIQGVRTGKVLTIVNQTPVALTAADYPPGRLITLSDPTNWPVS